jgi:pyruvate dehydrogenase E2 component (dihydrolipoamide acetyltransferase)
MPPLSETMEDGRIVRWYKAEGDTVNEGEPLYDVETDKATVEVPAPAAGIVRRIMVLEGETVPIGTMLAVIAGPEDEIAL